MGIIAELTKIYLKDEENADTARKIAVAEDIMGGMSAKRCGEALKRFYEFAGENKNIIENPEKWVM